MIKKEDLERIWSLLQSDSSSKMDDNHVDAVSHAPSFGGEVRAVLLLIVAYKLRDLGRLQTIYAPLYQESFNADLEQLIALFFASAVLGNIRAVRELGVRFETHHAHLMEEFHIVSCIRSDIPDLSVLYEQADMLCWMEDSADSENSTPGSGGDGKKAQAAYSSSRSPKLSPSPSPSFRPIASPPPSSSFSSILPLHVPPSAGDGSTLRPSSPSPDFLARVLKSMRVSLRKCVGSRSEQMDAVRKRFASPDADGWVKMPVQKRSVIVQTGAVVVMRSVSSTEMQLCGFVRNGGSEMHLSGYIDVSCGAVEVHKQEKLTLSLSDTGAYLPGPPSSSSSSSFSSSVSSPFCVYEGTYEVNETKLSPLPVERLKTVFNVRMVLEDKLLSEFEDLFDPPSVIHNRTSDRERSCKDQNDESPPPSSSSLDRDAGATEEPPTVSDNSKMKRNESKPDDRFPAVDGTSRSNSVIKSHFGYFHHPPFDGFFSSADLRKLRLVSKAMRAVVEAEVNRL